MPITFAFPGEKPPFEKEGDFEVSTADDQDEVKIFIIITFLLLLQNCKDTCLWVGDFRF